MLIFDRSQNDVDSAIDIIKLVKESGVDSLADDIKNLYYKGLKGSYNLSDVRRVYNFINDLLVLLNANGYMPSIHIKTYSDNDIFSELDIKNYLNNIKELRGCITVWNATPQAPSVNDWIDYKVANAIEKILFDISEILKLVQLSRIHSGTINSSNNILLPQMPLSVELVGPTFAWLDNKNIIWRDIDTKALNWLEFEFKDW